MTFPSAAAAPVTTGSVDVASNFERRVFLFLGAIALVYACFAGLRTVSDFDLGWQIATGRWILQHHSIPSVDVFSYTAAGQPWIYPIGGGIVFYIAYLAGGYALISWIGAAACVGSVALLLRKNSGTGAAIAIVAVPVIALRMTPRADMFSVVLFAAFLSVLWEQHRTGRARLWLLPLLMIAWVNLHLGFIAGLALIAAYAVAELLEAATSGPQRRDALHRLGRAAPWLGCATLATLINPWGWGIYQAMLLQERVNKPARILIAEWSGLPLTWSAITNSISLRQTSGALYLLLAVAIVAAALALLRPQLGAAILLLGGSYVAAHHVRLSAVYACVVVVVAAPILSKVVSQLGSRLERPRARSLAAAGAIALFGLLATVRCFDLATDRFYLRGSSESNFGAGLSWWFPLRAAEFIERENLPGEIFSSYNHGGFLTWKLAQRRDTIDGRTAVFGVPAIQHNSKLLQVSPDSPLWQQEAVRYNINTILLPLARFDGIELVRLKEFCNSASWRPVYLDEVSAVFVRREAPGAAALLQSHAVDCVNAPLPSNPPPANHTVAFNAWSNAASVLAALGRNSEALTATDNAMAIFSDSSFVHWLRGNLLSAMARTADAEEEYRTAVSLDSSDVAWAALAEFYRNHGRNTEAIDGMRRAVSISARPYTLLSNLGYLYLRTNQPDQALRTFDEAERSAPAQMAAVDGGVFDFMLAQGRSVAWNELGNQDRAIVFEEKAARLEPNAPEVWRRLAKLYRQRGRTEDAIRAELSATAAEQSVRDSR